MNNYTPKQDKDGKYIEVAATIRQKIYIEDEILDNKGNISHKKAITQVRDYFESLDGSPDAGSCLMGIADKDITIK